MISQKILFTRKDINEILSLIDKEEFLTSKGYHNGNSFVNLEHRNSSEITVQARGRVHNLLFDKFKEFNVLNMPYSFKIIEYKTGSFFLPHKDSTSRGQESPYSRVKTAVIQLSEPSDYNGGDLVIYNDESKHTVSRDIGNTVLFNSDLTHEVTLITSGTRYSVVCWFNYGHLYKKANIL